MSIRPALNRVTVLKVMAATGSPSNRALNVSSTGGAEPLFLIVRNI